MVFGGGSGGVDGGNDGFGWGGGGALDFWLFWQRPATLSNGRGAQGRFGWQQDLRKRSAQSLNRNAWIQRVNAQASDM